MPGPSSLCTQQRSVGANIPARMLRKDQPTRKRPKSFCACAVHRTRPVLRIPPVAPDIYRDPDLVRHHRNPWPGGSTNLMPMMPHHSLAPASSCVCQCAGAIEFVHPARERGRQRPTTYDARGPAYPQASKVFLRVCHAPIPKVRVQGLARAMKHRMPTASAAKSGRGGALQRQCGPRRNNIEFPLQNYHSRLGDAT